MKRQLCYSAIALLTFGSAMASPISPQEAFDRIQDNGFLIQAESFGNTRAMTVSPRLLKTFDDSLGDPSIYVFDQDNSQGFMIVSADDAVTPLLGYSTQGTFDADNMPPALEYWLGEYQAQIEYARKAGVTSLGKTRAASLPSWAPITPLVKTIWNQDAPFYNLCPKYSNYYCATGCVATSMSQAMNYFQWPKQGQGSVSYTSSAIRQNLTLDFSKVTFDWANMIDSYNGSYTSEQATAVATLMQAAGYSVQMQYTPNESGAASAMITGALVRYFNYDPSIRYYERALYTYTDWATMLYNNLKDVGPVIYNGTGSEGGHSWICDGYQGDGYFHFNWGWGGVSDGYFLLNALDPEELGIGGGAGGFVLNQAAVFNMKPATGASSTPQNEVVMYGSLTASVATGSSNLTAKPVGTQQSGFFYTGQNSQYMVDFGFAFVPSSTPNATPTFKYAATQTLTPSTYIPTFSLNLNNQGLQNNVEYIAYVAYRYGGVVNIIDAAPGSYNYVLVTPTSSRFNVKNMTPTSVTPTSITLDSNLMYGVPVNVSATVTNTGTEEINHGIALALLNSNGTKTVFTGEDYYFVTLSPGETQTVKWTTYLSLASGATAPTKSTTYQLALADYDTGAVTSSNQTATMTVPDPSVPNVYTYAFKVNGDAPSNNTWTVSNPDNFNIETIVNVQSGYMADYLYMCLYASQVGTTTLTLKYTYPLNNNALILLNSGESGSWTTNASCPDVVAGDRYFPIVINSSGRPIDGNTTLSQYINFTQSSGVESLEVEQGEIILLYNQGASSLIAMGGENGIAAVEAYYLNGMRAPIQVNVMNGNATVDLSQAGKGVIVVVATDNAGNRKSMKLAL